MVGLFWDDDAGGLFTTGADAESLVVRQKDFLDNATPSANSQAALALLRLAALTGESGYEERATAILRLFGPIASRQPTAFAHLLAALDLHHTGATEVAVVGDRSDLLDVARSRCLPSAVLAWGEPYVSRSGRGGKRARLTSAGTSPASSRPTPPRCWTLSCRPPELPRRSPATQRVGQAAPRGAPILRPHAGAASRASALAAGGGDRESATWPALSRSRTCSPAALARSICGPWVRARSRGHRCMGWPGSGPSPLLGFSRSGRVPWDHCSRAGTGRSWRLLLGAAVVGHNWSPLPSRGRRTRNLAGHRRPPSPGVARSGGPPVGARPRSGGAGDRARLLPRRLGAAAARGHARS